MLIVVIQNILDRPTLESMHLGPFKNVIFICSATLFWCGVLMTVRCLTISSFLQNKLNSHLRNSKTLFVWKLLIILIVCFSINAFQCKKLIETSLIAFNKYVYTFLGKSSITIHFYNYLTFDATEEEIHKFEWM